MAHEVAWMSLYIPLLSLGNVAVYPRIEPLATGAVRNNALSFLSSKSLYTPFT